MRTFNSETPKYVVASFWDRALAGFLDVMIILALSSPLSVVFAAAEIVFLNFTGMEQVPVYFRIATILLNMLFGLFYYAYHYKNRGTSLGKSILNMKVVVLPYSETPNLKVAFLRDIFGKIVSTLPFFAGYLVAFFRADRRTLHDLMAKTVVIKRVH